MPKVVIFESTESLPKFYHAASRKSINDFKDDDSRIDHKQLADYIHEQVEVNGNPLVIGDFNTLPSWDRELFHLNRFLELYEDKVQVFHMVLRYTVSMSTDEFLKRLQQRDANDLQDNNDDQQEDTDDTKKRFDRYGKDLSCPTVIQEKLRSMLPNDLLPLDTTDLFVHMPKHLRAENLMCYVGSDGTGTAVHRDICATLGHNLMIYGDENAYSEWIMITNDERPKLLQAIHQTKSKYNVDSTTPIKSSTFVETDRGWVSRKHVHQQRIKTHVILQRPGDLVLVPSMCYHQVRNVNTSIKVAWNRATPRSLQMAVQKQLPIYQRLIRPEVYRCKAMVYRTILSLTNANDNSREVPSMDGCDDDDDHSATVPGTPLMNDTSDTNMSYSKGRPPLLTHAKSNTHAEYEECSILADLFYYDILLPEAIEPIRSEGVDDKNIYCDMKIRDDMFEGICDFCHADIFYRYYHCSSCNYDICMACYSQGRSCNHMDQLVMAQGIIPFDQLVKVYTDFIDAINATFEDFKAIPNRLTKAGRFRFDGQRYNLATLCRRLEKYRQRNKMFSNYFSCGHCHKLATLEELYNEEGLDLPDIFGQKRCQQLRSNQKLNMAWVCTKCARQCGDGCEVPEKKSGPKVDELVYYLPPENDARNMGGPSDKCFNKTLYWPRKNVEQEGVSTKWTKDDLRGQILGSLMDKLHPRTLKSDLPYRHTMQKLVEGLTINADHWFSLVVEKLKKVNLRRLTLSPPKDMPGFSNHRRMIIDLDNVILKIPKGTKLVEGRKKRHENNDNSTPDNEQNNDNISMEEEDEDLPSAERDDALPNVSMMEESEELPSAERNDTRPNKRRPFQANGVERAKRSKRRNPPMEEEDPTIQINYNM